MVQVLNDCRYLMYKLFILYQVIAHQNPAGIPSFSAGKFRWQPVLSDNPDYKSKTAHQVKLKLFRHFNRMFTLCSNVPAFDSLSGIFGE